MADKDASTVPLRPEAEATVRSDSQRPLTPQQLGAVSLAEGPGEARYEPMQLLGAGGMGEVRLCRDVRIGREVARKMMRPEAMQWADGRQRFVREARVQGQLEHPAVVPVYDLGEDDGAPWFVMKRLRGQTLADVVQALGENQAEALRHFTRRRLLTAFSQVCLAVDFAHSRGVIHRDLKPANVMLGDFGEVHLLDWGLARVVGANEAPVPAAVTSPGAGPAATQLGEVMGTPGYMAPEQARGQVDLISPKTDVYSLGAVLFELLTLEPLNPGSSSEARRAATLAAGESSPMLRAPSREVPLELDALVLACCATDPASRPSARELSEAVEHFLDGDRDLRRRQELASEHVAAARAAMHHSASRGAAMKAVTRALALVPDQPEGLSLLGQLLTEVPTVLPPEARAQMEAAQAAARGSVAGVAAARIATWMVFIPLVWWMGVRDWRTAGFTIAALGLSFAVALALRLRGKGLSNLASLGLLLLSSLALVGVGFVVSPLVLVPALAATNTMFFATHLSSRARPLAALAGLVAVLAPLALEAFGVVSPSFVFSGGRLELLPRMAELAATPTVVLLLVGSAALVVTPAVLVGRLRDSLEIAEKKLFLHAWHLKALAGD